MITYSINPDYISLNEINYVAFDEASEEFHQELFGFIQSWLGVKVDKVDVWLYEQKFAERKPEYNFYFVNPETGQLMPDTKGGYQNHPKTLPYCVRNQIDHPHIQNQRFSNHDYIRQSIEIMVNVLRSIAKMHTKFRIFPHNNSAKALDRSMTIDIETKYMTLNPFYSSDNINIIQKEYENKYNYNYKDNDCKESDFHYEPLT